MRLCHLAKENRKLSFNDFNKWYEGLNRNQSAKNRIIKHLPPGAANRLNTFYTLSQGIERATRETVGTGRIQTLLKPFEKEGMIENVYGKASKVAQMVPGAAKLAGPVGAVAELLTRGNDTPSLMQAADKLLASPEFRNALVTYGDKSVRSEAKQKAAEKALKSSNRYKIWLKNLEKFYPEQYRELIQGGLKTYFTGEEF